MFYHPDGLLGLLAQNRDIYRLRALLEFVSIEFVSIEVAFAPGEAPPW
jgi:hypothetical protein